MMALIAFVLIAGLYVIVLRIALILDDVIEGKDIEGQIEKLRDEFAEMREEKDE